MTGDLRSVGSCARNVQPVQINHLRLHRHFRASVSTQMGDEGLRRYESALALPLTAAANCRSLSRGPLARQTVLVVVAGDQKKVAPYYGPRLQGYANGAVPGLCRGSCYRHGYVACT